MIRTLAVSLLFTWLNFSTAIAAAKAHSWAQLLNLQDQHKAQIQQQDEALVLKQHTQIRVKSSDQIEYTKYRAIAVNNDQAATDYRQISHSFNSFYEDIALDFARLIDAKGKRHQVSADAIQIQTANRASSYDDIRYLVFSLPGMEAGALFEYQIRITTKQPMIEGHWNERILFNPIQYTNTSQGVRLDAALSSVFDLYLPKGQRLFYASVNESITPKLTEHAGSTQYQWRKDNLAGVTLEPYMPPLLDRVPYIELSNSDDWSIMDQWAQPHYLPKAALLAQIGPLLPIDFTKLATVRDKAEAIFYYVQNNINYIEADFLRGGVIPHSPLEVLKNRYGDCKDQSVLIASTLRALGISAYPALVTVRPQPNVLPGVVTNHFSHSIVYVEDGDAHFFMDTSGDTGPFPGIDFSVEGALAFVLNGKGGKLVEVAHSSPQDNIISADVHYQRQQADLIIHSDLMIKGSLGNRLKSTLKANQDIQKVLNELSTQLYPKSEPVHAELLDKDVIRKPLILAIKVKYPGYYETQAEKHTIEGNLMSILSSFSMLYPSPEGARSSDFVSEIPIRLDYRVTIDSAPKGNKQLLITGAQINNKWLTLKHTKRQLNNQHTLHYELEIPAVTIQANDYKRFHTHYTEALDQASWHYMYSEQGRTLALESQGLKNAPAQSAPELIDLTKQLLSSGDYARALTLAKQAVEQFPDTAEAHYLLGLSYGFSDEFELSDQALEKAKSLGYQF